MARYLFDRITLLVFARACVCYRGFIVWRYFVNRNYELSACDDVVGENNINTTTTRGHAMIYLLLLNLSVNAKNKSVG